MPPIPSLRTLVAVCALVPLAACSSSLSDQSAGLSGASLMLPAMAFPAGTPMVSVQPGDTLETLAARHGVPPSELARLNGLQPPYQLAVGQRLGLPMTRTHVVAKGESLSRIAERFDVPMRDLVAANGLASPDLIKAGQTLIIPNAGEQMAALPMGTDAPPPPARRTPPRNPDADSDLSDTSPLPIVPAASRPAGPPADPSIPILPVARPPVAADAGAPRPPEKPPVRPDTASATPGAAAKPATAPKPPAAAAAKPAEAPKKPAEPQTAAATAPEPAEPAQPKPPAQTAAAAPTAEAPKPATTGGSGGRFRWPVQGTVVSRFGENGNRGVNIAASKGTPVQAADGGKVIYAGNLPDYGNTVMVRHDGGYITVYSHLDQIKVGQNQDVAPGTPVGAAGATGNVSSPQVHFEVRKGSAAQDPATYLGG